MDRVIISRANCSASLPMDVCDLPLCVRVIYQGLNAQMFCAQNISASVLGMLRKPSNLIAIVVTLHEYA